MNTMIGVLLASAVFVTFCDAECSYMPLEIIPGIKPTGCKDIDGKMHAFSSQWMSGCEECTCDEKMGISCCSRIKRPVDYDEDKCMEIFSEELCEISVVEKANPSTTCKVKGYVG
ncbi:beta-microseminoprotein J1-like [Macrotis lagotis]|uniref:beta-microseminoprotein J1-like n=1 Tax=Macrotis lagotis TaxID=92651 RepID=UPI003D696FEA